ncbi:DUF2634 domain-containing protein [Paenibacillus sp. 32O-W]|uniref:DUF2634 domain-containing protein n=1 Tax=Paenibacillus sp. 32O-W TaxID=1695218 RepID=UPI0021B5ECCA|nr:DUF2634 domain-containing protein [Paenibacillus sp. 32O-W]
MSNLPQITQLEFPTSDIVQRTEKQAVHSTFDWDFEKGDFKLKDGAVIKLTGIEYLKVWIQKALRTVKNSLIYAGTGYGSEHHSLIGRNFHPDFSRSEYERMIREALMQNDAITQVDQFSFTQVGARLKITFNVASIFGPTEGTVTV